MAETEKVSERFPNNLVTKLIGPELGDDVIPIASAVPGQRGYEYDLKQLVVRIEAWKANGCKRVSVPKAPSTNCIL